MIVVLDGDIDASANVLGRFASEHPGMALRTIVFPENRGKVATMPAGANAADGLVLIRCDEDLKPDPDYVRAYLAAHQGEAVGVVGLCRSVFPENAYAPVYGRAADERLSGHDKRYRAYGWEDIDYGYRLQKMCIPIRIRPACTTAHYVGAKTTAVRALRAHHSGAARKIFLAKQGAGALCSTHQRRSLWSLLVAAARAVATERTIRTAGAAIDTASAILPRRLAAKLWRSPSNRPGGRERCTHTVPAADFDPTALRTCRRV